MNEFSNHEPSASSSGAKILSAVSSFLLGTGVNHHTFGFGVISGISEHHVQVEFDAGPKSFMRTNFLDFFTIEVADITQLRRIQWALLENVFVAEKAAALVCQVSDYLKSHGGVESKFDEGELRLRFTSLEQMDDDRKPVINDGFLSCVDNAGSLLFQYTVLFLMDEQMVQEMYEDGDELFDWDDQMVRGLLDIAQLYDHDATFDVFFMEEYDQKPANKLISDGGMYLGLRVRKPIDNLNKLIVLKAVLETFVEKCRTFIDCYAIQPQRAPALDLAIEVDNTEEIALSYQDFLIISNRRGCIAKNHDMQKIMALLSVVQPNGRVDEVRIPAFYCQVCDEYYMHDYDFSRAIAGGGVLMCKLIYEKQYHQESYGDFSNLQPQSILNLCGYNVNRTEALSVLQRRTILDRIINSEVLELLRVKSHISWLIKGRKEFPRYLDAVRKWEADLEYLKNEYHEDGRRVLVKSITAKR